MRFKRYGRYPFNDTPRKRAAVLRKQRNEREALPLFADQIAAEQASVDDVMIGRAVAWDNHEARSRAYEARKWREARARLRAYLPNERRALAAYWQRCGWPAVPSYLLSMLHMYDTNRLDLAPVIGPLMFNPPRTPQAR